MSALKVGDRVRLTGEEWPKDMAGREFTLTKWREEGPAFEFDDLTWVVTDGGWEAKLVRPMEDEPLADWERELLEEGDRQKTFAEKVAARTDAIRDLLIEKNRKYGNSALDPLRVFSTADPVETLKVRIDDKLSRIKRGVGDDEDTVTDLTGYLILLMIARDSDD